MFYYYNNRQFVIILVILIYYVKKFYFDLSDFILKFINLLTDYKLKSPIRIYLIYFEYLNNNIKKKKKKSK